MASELNKPHFQDATKAREYLEAVRWPNGPVCPHCAVIGGHYQLGGKAHRPGLWKCFACREQFSVTVGTVFERSKIKLNVWLQAVFLLCSSKKGMSSKQIERTLGVTYKTAWFITHRIREAMKAPGGMFSTGGTVEADETYVGSKEHNKHRYKRDSKKIGGMGKQMVFSLVERGGMVRSMHLTSVNATTLRPILDAQVDTVNTRLMTDGEGQYRLVASMFKSHDVVNHSAGEYVRGNAHTNTVEGYFSILKRGIYGTFHSVSPQHLQRYCNEFDFRYNHRQVKRKIDGQWQLVGPSDGERTIAALKGIGGKRLTYRTPHSPT
jgi:transposase-like protein